ncbi:ABC transporter permease [Ruicaihuangia caeni]|uniref:ABC transporter permease n=1 Tax=Ruicaihuangia caeni TaxID=3042517 RepID=UPI00338FB21D
MFDFIATVLRDAGPLLWVALGGLIAYRVGVFHLGLEGLMAVGAFVSVAVTIGTGNVWLGLLAAVLASVALSVVFWLAIAVFKGNMIIVGLGLTTLGLALASFLQIAIFETQGAIRAPAGLPILVPSADSSSPLAMISGLPITTLLLPIVTLAMWVLLRRSSFGLRVTAVGDFPFAARSAGYSPSLTRLIALVVSGALIAVGGAELALGGLNSFSQDMTAGRGFVAFTAVIFGAAAVWGVAGACVFFGISTAIGIAAQLQGWAIPIQFVLALPYVLTIVAVAIAAFVARNRSGGLAGFAELRD